VAPVQVELASAQQLWGESVRDRGQDQHWVEQGWAVDHPLPVCHRQASGRGDHAVALVVSVDHPYLHHHHHHHHHLYRDRDRDHHLCHRLDLRDLAAVVPDRSQHRVPQEQWVHEQEKQAEEEVHHHPCCHFVSVPAWTAVASSPDRPAVRRGLRLPVSVLLLSHHHLPSSALVSSGVALSRPTVHRDPLRPAEPGQQPPCSPRDAAVDLDPVAVHLDHPAVDHVLDQAQDQARDLVSHLVLVCRSLSQCRLDP
jgi:hypothetical protein